MKGIFTQLVLCVLLLQAFYLPAFSQPDYSFTSAVHESGTALQPGAVYKFSNVKGGTDARITVLGSTGNVTLASFDENWTGFDEAFQPFINVGPLANGYVEFRIDFYEAGTMTPKSQSSIPVTCIDVDGLTFNNGVLYEHDQVEFLPGYYDYALTGGNLQVQSLSGWISIKNISGFSYPGIDTMAKDVMATVLNRNTSSFKLRIGASNTSATESDIRYRSVYFKKFNYGHQEPLAQKTILNLSGNKKTGGTELKVTLAAGHSYDKMIIERSAFSASSFTMLAQENVAGKNGTTYTHTFLDIHTESGVNYYYRVKLVNSASSKEEISNILLIKEENPGNGLKIVNTVIQAANPVLLVRADNNREAAIRITDLSGKLLYNGMLKLNMGTNTITLNPLSRSLSYAMLQIETREERKSTRILIQ